MPHCNRHILRIEQAKQFHPACTRLLTLLLAVHTLSLPWLWAYVPPFSPRQDLRSKFQMGPRNAGNSVPTPRRPAAADWAPSGNSPVGG